MRPLAPVARGGPVSLSDHSCGARDAGRRRIRLVALSSSLRLIPTSGGQWACYLINRGSDFLIADARSAQRLSWSTPTACIYFTIEVGSDPVAGSFSRPGEDQLRFVGWLELLVILEAVHRGETVVSCWDQVTDE